MKTGTLFDSGGRLLFALVLVMTSGIRLASGQVVADNFDDNLDNGWTRYDPIGSHPQLPDIASFTLANGTYRIRTAPSPAPTVAGPGRAGALQAGTTYLDFHVAVDFVTWDTNLDQAFGVLARIREPGLQTTDGFALTVQVGDGDMSISRITDEVPADLANSSKPVTLVLGRRYRMTFSGQGEVLTGRLYDLANPTVPIVETTGSDLAPEAGICGLVIYDNSGSAGPQRTDVTFDNYLSLPAEPPRLAVAMDFGTVVVSWPRTAAGFKLQRASVPSQPQAWEDVDTFFIDATDPGVFRHYINPEDRGVIGRFRLKL